MTVRLSWGNTNPNADSVIIYRATAPFAESALPTALATLAGNATTYDDTTVPRNSIAYYRARVTRGSEELISPLMVMGHFPDSGPGPQTLLRGNWSLGYFGRVPVANMWTVAAFRTAVGATGLGAGGSEASLTFWHKFVRNGKILFIPGTYMGNNVTWQQLYLLGLVYGTNDNGAVPSGLTSPPAATNQQKIITLGAYSFLVRAPLGCTMPVNAVTGAAYANNINGSEWDETMGRCYNGWTNPTNTARVDDIVASSIRSVTQHLYAVDKTVIVRGNATVIDAASVASLEAWTPIVELIPT